MKRKSNYILPDDDVQGQQSFKGLENTLRVSPVEPVQIQIKEPFKPVDCSILGVKSKLFEENLSKLLKKIKE